MKKIRIKTRRQNDREWAANRATPMLRNDNSCIAAHADYDRDHYIFLRAQTRQMQMMEWENRLAPVKRWGSNMVANLAFAMFA